MSSYDTLILGSGAAGLTAAIYAKRAGLRFAVLEREFMGTGQIAEAPQVDNYPGLPGLDGYSLGERLRAHAESLGTEFLEGEAVRISRDDTEFSVDTADGAQYRARTLIYALGAAHRPLTVPGAERLTGAGVSYCAVCDGAFYQGKTVAVIGGGDSALGDALTLANLAKTVYLVHRRAEFRANAAVQQQVANRENIVPVLQAQLNAVTGDSRVEAIELTQNGEAKTLPVDGVFAAIGMIPNTALLADFSVLDGHGFVIAGETGTTAVPGLFAAGDVRTKALRQVITACADGANAVFSAENYLRSE